MNPVKKELRLPEKEVKNGAVLICNIVWVLTQVAPIPMP